MSHHRSKPYRIPRTVVELDGSTDGIVKLVSSENGVVRAFYADGSQGPAVLANGVPLCLETAMQFVRARTSVPVRAGNAGVCEAL